MITSVTSRIRGRRRTAGRILIGAVVSALLAACSATSASGNATALGPSALVAPKKHVTITVMTWQPGGPGLWKTLISGFEAKYPTITVNQEVVPYTAYPSKLGEFRSAGSGPDVLDISAGAYLLQYSDILTPLNKEVKDIIGNLYDANNECEDFNCSKNVYGLTTTLQGHPLYYNKKLLASLKIAPPTTWSQLAAACKTLTRAGKACIATGMQGGTELGVMLELLQETSSLGQCQGLFTGSSHYTDANFVASLKLFQNQIAKWVQPGAVGDSLAPQAQDYFETGKAGFFTGLIGDYYDWNLLAQAMGKGNIGVINYPPITAADPGNGITPGPLENSLDVTGGTAMAVAKWTKQPAAAFLFARYMVSQQAQEEIVKVGGSYPALKTLNLSSVGSPALNDISKIVGKSQGSCYLYLNAATYDPIGREAQLLALGQTTPSAAAQVIQAALASAKN